MCGGRACSPGYDEWRKVIENGPQRDAMVGPIRNELKLLKEVFLRERISKSLTPFNHSDEPPIRADLTSSSGLEL